MATSESFTHRLNAYGVGIGPGAEVILEIENRDGPQVSDMLLVLTIDQANALSRNLLQSITQTEVKEPPAPVKTIQYPIPPADLAQHLYGYPYAGEEFT